MTPPEFHRPVRLDTLGAAPRTITIAADPAERVALARRFDLVSVEALEATAEVWRDAGGPMAKLALLARFTQACIATGQPVPAKLDVATRLRFQPAGDEIVGDEIELSIDECDTVFFEGGTIDLGEAAAETLALEMNPFPRSPGADALLREAGVVAEDEVENAAFSGLKALKQKLEGKGKG